MQPAGSAGMFGDIDTAAAGRSMHAFASEMFPICRSITGDGVRRTLSMIGERMPLSVSEVPSGTPVLDWTVPDEWTIRDAWVADSRGQRVIDFARSNLHVVGYSVPVRERLSLAALRPRLHSLPDQPDLTPFRSSFYQKDWGFCLPHRVLESLADDFYDVCIDATLAPGSLTYGECLLPGQTGDEVLISCHVCHPSLANDNLSGIALATELARAIAAVPHRYSYRFVFVPVTIGAIAWLARNEAVWPRIRHGIVLSCVGDAGMVTYKQSRHGSAPVDRAFAHVLAAGGAPHRVEPFTPYGYDERQYCSPGINLPVGCLMRTPNGRYPQYHTSGDNLDLIRPDALADSLVTCLRAIDVLERDCRYLNLSPRGEPQLGRRGLYRAMGGQADVGQLQMAMLWVLNQSDGQHRLLDIAERSALPFDLLARAAAMLQAHGLLQALAEPVT